VLLEIIEAHPEKTVIGVLEVNSFFVLLSPKRTGIAPISFPLEPTPWVPEEDEFVIVKLPCVDERVGMLNNQAEFFFQPFRMF
jgi:hypothetical protein